MIQDDRGFTLIELMIAIALSIIVIMGVYDLFISQQRAYSIQEEIVEMHQNALGAIELMILEIRMAGYDPTENAFPTENGDTKIAEAKAESIHFYSDLNGDGNFDDTVGEKDKNEDIIYLYDKTNQIIRRKTDADGGRMPLVENITDLTFEYYDKYGRISYEDIDDQQEQGRRDAIRRIKLSFTARTARKDPYWPHDDGYRYRTFEANVKLRNLGG